MENMKKYYITFLLTFLLCCPFLVSADLGPKPFFYRIWAFSDEPAFPPTELTKEQVPGFTYLYVIMAFIALCITVIVETVVALIYVVISKLSYKLLAWVLLVNTLSLPLLWITAYYNKISNDVFLWIAEIIIVLFEAWFIRKMFKQLLTWKATLILSIVMNTASYFIGDQIINYLIHNV